MLTAPSRASAVSRPAGGIRCWLSSFRLTETAGRCQTCVLAPPASVKVRLLVHSVSCEGISAGFRPVEFVAVLGAQRCRATAWPKSSCSVTACKASLEFSFLDPEGLDYICKHPHMPVQSSNCPTTLTASIRL